MEQYIKGNKEAWEEAFDQRDPSWCEDIVVRIQNNDYAYFNRDMMEALKKYDMTNKSIGQFCCNNGRELLSLVKTTKAAEGIGFDIAENQVRFANEKAQELKLPCQFVAANVLEIDDSYANRFDFVLITIGALCWFKDLKQFFQVVSKCMKKDGVIVINEQHPMTNMLIASDEDGYDPDHAKDCVHSYFYHEWTGNDGMYYITGKNYKSKTFTDYTHSISDILGSICANHMVVTNMQEFDYDIGGGFEELNGTGFPLSMIVEGKRW